MPAKGFKAMTRYPGRATSESRINPQASFTWTKPKLTKERVIFYHLFIAPTFELCALHW